MSELVPYKGGKASAAKVRDYVAKAVGIDFAPNNVTHVRLESGQTGAGVCLGCSNAPCIAKDVDELALEGILGDFPGDPSLAVCPTDAIAFDDALGLISVDSKSCIGCGLCVVRCPYGAITLSNNETVTVATADTDRLTTNKVLHPTHPRPKKLGTIGVLSGDTAITLVKAVSCLADVDRNLFIRNLLHETGMGARVRRRGDMNVRMDAVGYTKSKRPFVAEIELVGGELESPRALLEDVAVLHARYGFEVRGIDALSIILTFPNVRSEYYQVIRDFEKILGIKCRTLTVGALLSLVWAGKTIDGFDGAAFGVEERGIDLAESLNIPGQAEPYLGAFKPAK